jgi:hypothetical protein
MGVAKSDAEGGGSEQCLRNHLRGGKSARQTGKKHAIGTLPISLGSALGTNSLCRGQEKHRIGKAEIQIGNPGHGSAAGDRVLQQEELTSEISGGGKKK